MIFHLAQDLHDTFEAMPREHPKHRMLGLLEEAIRRDIHFIAHHPTTLFQCMWNTCWWYDCPDAAQHYEKPEGGWASCQSWMHSGPKLHLLLEVWRNARENVEIDMRWICSLRPSGNRLGTGQRAIFRGHSDGVYSVRFLVGGQQIVSGGRDKTVRIWDVATGKEILCLSGHEPFVQRVECLPDGRHLAVWTIGRESGYLHIWDLDSGQKVRSLAIATRSNVVAIVPGNPCLALFGCEDGTISAWDMQAGEVVFCLRGHTDLVTALAVSYDGLRVFSRSGDGTLRAWDLVSRQQVWCATVRSGARLAASPNGSLVASNRNEDAQRDIVWLWDGGSGVEIGQLEGFVQSLNALVWSPDGRWIASACGDQVVHVWDALTRKLVRQCFGHTHQVADVAFSPDSECLASASWDATVQVWGLICDSTGHSNHETSRHIQRLVVSPDHRIVAAITGWQSVVCLWNAQTGILWRELHTGKYYVEIIDFSNDGEQIATAVGWGEPTVRVWSLRTGEQVASLNQEGEHVCDMEFAPNGRDLATGGYDRAVRIWDWATGKQLHCLSGHSSWVHRIAYSPDGQRIASGSLDSTVRIWDTQSGEALVTFSGHKLEIDSVAWSPDGQFIASASRDKSIRLWNSETGTEVLCFRNERDFVDDLAFSADCDRLAARCWSSKDLEQDVEIRVWSTRTGDCLETVNGNSDVSAVVMGAKVVSYRLVGKGSESVIKHAAGGKVVGWFPKRMDKVRMIAPPSLWAVAHAWELLFVTFHSSMGKQP